MKIYTNFIYQKYLSLYWLHFHKIALFACVTIGSFFMVGCAAILPTTATGVATSVATSTAGQIVKSEGLPPSGGTLNTKSRAIDFDDILIPKGLGLQKNESVIFTVNNISAGRLVFKGRLEVTSLGRFFMDTMIANGWVFLASSSHSQSILFFSKTDRSCIIQIWETMVYSFVSVWVTPNHSNNTNR